MTNLAARLLRVFAIAALCALTSFTAADAEDGEGVELTLDEVRAFAFNALKNGDYETAIQLSRGLLQADSEDPAAYFILAMAHGSLGDSTLSRKAAGYAYRFSDVSEDRFYAGQIAAQAAFRENRLSLAQFWLRRTAVHADDAQKQEIVARDYKTLRRLNPWSLRIDVALRPSNNVNNGSEDAIQIIDGVPVTGRLSGAARALSGVIGTVDVTSNYRLSVNDIQASYVGLRLYTRLVALSDSARDQAPNLSNSDLSQYYLETSFSHRRQVREGVLGGSAAIGQSWSGNDAMYRFARGSADRVWSFDSGAWFSLGGIVEERDGVDGPRYDATSYTLNLRGGHQLNNGDTLNLTLGLRDTDAWFRNDTNQSASLRANYSFAKPMGPVQVDLGLTLGYSDYSEYMSGFIVVPGGRQDKSVYADVNLMYEDWDYAGFAPSLRIRAGRTTSNDSRFNTRELSVGLGFRSKF